MDNKKYFLGWTNIKWFISEIVRIYSHKESFFSKKRIESGIAFTIAQFGMVMYLLKHVDTMSSSDMALWSSIEFAISGYILHTIQKEKNNIDNTEQKD